MLKAIILTASQMEDIAMEKSKRFKLVEEVKWEHDEDWHALQKCFIVFKDLNTNIVYGGYVKRYGEIDEYGQRFTNWVLHTEHEYHGHERAATRAFAYYPLEKKEVTKVEYDVPLKYFSELIANRSEVVLDEGDGLVYPDYIKKCPICGERPKLLGDAEHYSPHGRAMDFYVHCDNSEGCKSQPKLMTGCYELAIDDWNEYVEDQSKVTTEEVE